MNITHFFNYYFMAFMATSVFATPPVSSNDGTDQDDSESETEQDRKAEYYTLFAKTMKMLKMNEKVAISWKESEEHSTSLKAELSNKSESLRDCF